jgi:hypothetical protein
LRFRLLRHCSWASAAASSLAHKCRRGRRRCQRTAASVQYNTERVVPYHVAAVRCITVVPFCTLLYLHVPARHRKLGKAVLRGSSARGAPPAMVCSAPKRCIGCTVDERDSGAMCIDPSAGRVLSQWTGCACGLDHGRSIISYGRFHATGGGTILSRHARCMCTETLLIAH